MSYRDIKKNVINQKIRQKQQLLFVWSLTYNQSDLGGPTRNIKVLADGNIACILDTQAPLQQGANHWGVLIL